MRHNVPRAFALAALLALPLAGCTTGDPFTDLTRATAKSVVRPVVAKRFPGPQAEAISDCVIDNATAPEILSLARDVGVEPGTATIQTVLTIVQRPATVNCIATNGIAPYAG